jgi:hypothetical protein
MRARVQGNTVTFKARKAWVRASDILTAVGLEPSSAGHGSPANLSYKTDYTWYIVVAGATPELLTAALEQWFYVVKGKDWRGP